MTMALPLLCRVVRRRIEKGEELTQILDDYPRLTEKERQELEVLLKK